MYTQCPDCSTAFRVTAEVLKQAAGKVRCGGCSNAFNALEFLSEQMPEQAANDRSTPPPELTAEPRSSEDGPMSISAEHSAALMKTLDELEGPDIRIEDTGAEWLVVDDEDLPDVEVDEDSASVEELRFDDNTPLPDEFNVADMPFQKAEHSETDESETEDEVDSDPDPELADISLGEPDEWADILDEVDDPVAPALPLEAELAALEDDDEPLDVDTQFALQAEAMGIDLSGINQSAIERPNEEPDEEPDEKPAEASDKDMAEEGPEEEPEDEPDEEADEEAEDEPDDPVLTDVESATDDEATRNHHFEDQSDEEEDEAAAPLEFGSVETAIRELEAQSDVFDTNFFDAAVADGPDDDEEDEQKDDDREPDPVVPPLSEEEQTLNLMIDEDLLRLAVEDEDGFASTIVIEKESAEDNVIAARESIAVIEDRSPGFETIVMEGEFIHTALDTEKQKADIAAGALLAEQSRADNDETYVPYSDNKRLGVIAAMIALVLLLILQVMHQSRETLATNPTFSKVMSPAYRTVGMPLSPAWDITGWRIEATFDELQGSADTGEEQLNISSRIGNKSDTALPYPLISVSLTDRFEETIGSRVLEPSEYLIDNLDPRELVRPGNRFNAAISIQSPAKEVAGYRLKVCYRLSSGQLRCNVPVFK